jgi:hypothetical protein
MKPLPALQFVQFFMACDLSAAEHDAYAMLVTAQGHPPIHNPFAGAGCYFPPSGRPAADHVPKRIGGRHRVLASTAAHDSRKIGALLRDRKCGAGGNVGHCLPTSVEIGPLDVAHHVLTDMMEPGFEESDDLAEQSGFPRAERHAVSLDHVEIAFHPLGKVASSGGGRDRTP